MYDKVKIWMPKMSNSPDISTYLEDAKMHTDLESGEVYTFGYLDNMRVKMLAGGYSISGSLARYLNGSNLYPLDIHTTAEAITKLCDALHMDLKDGKVTALEIGSVFSMRKSPDEYFKKLGEMPRLKRYHFEVGSLYYQPRGKQQSKVFAFYDKLAEAKAKGFEIPRGLEDANLLKYEMRLNNRLPKQIGVTAVEVSMLPDRGFYKKLVEMWQASYFSIRRKRQLNPNIMSEIKNVKDAYDAFVALLINQSDNSQINAFLEELKANKVFDDNKYYTRLKNKILEVSQRATIVLSDDDIKELDDEIRNAGAYV